MISNVKHSVVAVSTVSPFDSMSSVGPQSSAAKRTVLTKKLETARIQMYGFFSTWSRTNAL